LKGKQLHDAVTLMILNLAIFLEKSDRRVKAKLALFNDAAVEPAKQITIGGGED